MLIKIIDESSGDFNKEFKVRRMNYDQIVVNYPNSKGINIFLKKQVEFIFENKVDDFLIKYSDFLKIKLNRGISVALYKILLEDIEKQLEITFESLNLLKDKYKVNKRGVWEKEIFCVINDKYPITIQASGQNFKKNNFNININEISIKEFLEMCIFEIKKINKEIKEREELLSRFGMAIEKVKSGSNQVKMLT